jgi:hypothetical protein
VKKVQSCHEQKRNDIDGRMVNIDVVGRRAGKN